MARQPFDSISEYDPNDSNEVGAVKNDEDQLECSQKELYGHLQLNVI